MGLFHAGIVLPLPNRFPTEIVIDMSSKLSFDSNQPTILYKRTCDQHIFTSCSSHAVTWTYNSALKSALGTEANVETFRKKANDALSSWGGRKHYALSPHTNLDNWIERTFQETLRECTENQVTCLFDHVHNDMRLLSSERTRTGNRILDGSVNSKSSYVNVEHTRQ